jgi:type IV pilus assembly protein PilB
MIDFNEDKQNKRISDLKKDEEEKLTEAMAKEYDLPYLDLSVTPVNIDALRFVSELEAREAMLAPFNSVDKNVDIAILSPKNTDTLAVIDKIKKKGYNIRIFMVSHASLNKVWDRYKDLSYSFETKSGALDISNEQITDFLNEVHNIPDVTNLIQEVLVMKKGYRISRILEIILAGSIATGASDIHLEPEENYVRLRYRLDGMLTDILDFDKETFKLLLSRIKLISNLKLNIGGAQDGRFSIKLSNTEIEVRTSLLPGAYGESVVLRILNPNSISIPLEKLAIHPKTLEIILHEISKPNGMILTTGPTGSGKTTTLYAFLKKVHAPGVKIITIENPIEYHLPGIVQTQTDESKNYTFASGLRSALRQDPDIIMVGEIRDEETADIAINSALTGHLVFSTLHTNSAAGTFPRLIDLGINPKILSSAINIAMAQRLVRILCPNCKKKDGLNETEQKTVDAVLNTITDKSYIDGLDTKSTYRAVGCEKCNNTGFKGRLGIHEIILMTEEIEKIIKENPSEREIVKASLSQNLLNMLQDGIIKVINGTTTLEELSRVIDVEKI